MKAASFREEAVNNDLCYQKCKADRDQGDADFIREMLDKCDDAYKGRMWNNERGKSCRESVLKAGRSGRLTVYSDWKKAQIKACQRCP
jgi:hypothetical protein